MKRNTEINIEQHENHKAFCTEGRERTTTTTTKTLKCMEHSYLYFLEIFLCVGPLYRKGIDEYVDATSLLSCFFTGWPLLPDS